MYGHSTILIICLALPAAGCASQSQDAQSTTSPPTPQATAVAPSSTPGMTASTQNASAINDATTPGTRSACSLLENSEVTEVQGAPVQSTTPNQQTATGGLVTSQCYYTVISDKATNLSVHLQVMEADAKTPNAVTEYWETSLATKTKRRQKKGKDVPQTVANVGDEAVWVDTGKSGVLYALQKQKLVRISLGGGGDSKARLAKSKALIVKALARIS